MTRTSSRPPNVILVLTDDQGYADLGCTGNPWLHTPHIDAFSGGAVRCNAFHVSPLCTPTRGALMTGRYPMRNGAWATAWGRSILRREEVTVADVFRHNGYATGMFGKWHLGDTYPYRPQDRGFDVVVAHKGGGVGQTPDFWGNDYFDDTYFRNGEPQGHEGYCTDIWFDEAKVFIENRGDKPFFAYLSTNAPHSPYFVADRYAERYRGNPEIAEPEFYGMITNIDENFGKLEAFLKARGLADDTLLIFMTDNGSSGGAIVDDLGFPVAGYNAGMRGKKASYYEGGHRVPFFLRWSEGGLVDRDVDALLGHTDLLPTLVELFGLELPQPVEFDGVSFAACLEGRDGGPGRRNLFMQFHQSMTPPDKWNCAVLQENWRLIAGEELYDLHTDPGQKQDVATAHPEVVKELREAHDRFWEEVSVSLAEPCPHYLGEAAENPTRLDAMDVMGDIAWDQPHVLEARKTTGRWAVKVEQAGRFRFRMRRWPDELDLAIGAIPEGPPLVSNERHGASGAAGRVGAARAHLAVAEKALSIAVAEDDPEVVFELDLPPFTGMLGATFEDSEGNAQGAYYVYVERLGAPG